MENKDDDDAVQTFALWSFSVFLYASIMHIKPETAKRPQCLLTSTSSWIFSMVPSRICTFI
jgi:hypothetical protein